MVLGFAPLRTFFDKIMTKEEFKNLKMGEVIQEKLDGVLWTYLLLSDVDFRGDVELWSFQYACAYGRSGIAYSSRERLTKI